MPVAALFARLVLVDVETGQIATLEGMAAVTQFFEGSCLLLLLSRIR